MTTCGPYSDITVSIVSFNSQNVLGECLDSLPDGVDVRVFDNSSSDGTVDFIRSRYPHVELIVSDRNIGFGRGHNANLERITTPFALVLNPDSFLNSNAMTEMVTILRSHPDVAIVGPGAEGSVSGDDSGYRRYSPDEVNPHHVEQLSGHCLLIRMSAFEAIGFFDPNLFLFYEDTDLCTKARQAGHLLVLAPNTEVRHLVGKSTPTSKSTTRLRDYHLGWSEAYYRCKYRNDATRTTELFRTAFKHVRKAFVRLLRLSPKSMESLCRIHGIIDYAISGPTATSAAISGVSEDVRESETQRAA